MAEMSTIGQMPIFKELNNAQNVLIAGAGGGCDVYCGVPLLFYLLSNGKKVTLANYSDARLKDTNATEVHTLCRKIEGNEVNLEGQRIFPSWSGKNYFPETYLQEWLKHQGVLIDLYAFDSRYNSVARCGVKPLRESYAYILDTHSIDTILLVDGGTDALTHGDEESDGTPAEDCSSVIAVHGLDVPRKYLLCTALGVDRHHGVSGYLWLENVAQLTQQGGFLGAFSATTEMEEVRRFTDAVDFANRVMPARQSIVLNSMVSALTGFFGDYHRTPRTGGNELFINPLMALYWCFNLDKVAEWYIFGQAIADCTTTGEAGEIIHHEGITRRPDRPLPL